MTRIADQSGASVSRAEGNLTTTGNLELIILDSCVAGFHSFSVRFLANVIFMVKVVR